MSPKYNLKHILIIFILAVVIGAEILICYQPVKKYIFFLKLPEIGLEKEDGIKKKPEDRKFRWVCGSLHNHLMIFDNLEQNTRSLEEVIAVSKDIGFNFIMLSEKGPAFNEGTWAWQGMIRECDKNTANDFVCLSGQENCTQEKAPKKPRGHFVVIENKNYISEFLEVPELLNEAHRQGSIVIVAHPFYKEEISDMYNYNRWDIQNWEAIEVLDGVIDEESNQKALKKVYELWNQGVKKSITGGADFKNHQAYTNILLDRKEIKKALESGHTCLYLDELNRDAIISAIKGGHSYVSSGVRIREFSINSAMMGEKISVKKSEALNIKLDLKATVKIDKLLLIENGEILKKFEPNSNEFTKSISLSAEKSGWYGLEVYADEGEKAFTNAIWVEIKNQTGISENKNSVSATRISYQEETPDGFPSIFQLENGTLWVIFKSKPQSESNLFLVSSKDNGKNWSTEEPLKITDSKANAEHTSVIKKGDSVIIAWDDGNGIKYNTSSDNGKSWKQNEFDFGKSRYPYLYQVDQKIWYLFISEEKGLGGIIKYMTSDDGESWSETKEIIENPDQSGKTAVYGNPVLYRDKANGELWLLGDTGAEEEPVSDIWWMKSLDSGASWSQPEILTKNTEELDDVDPSICEYEGKPLLVYASRPEKNLNQDYKFYYKIYEGGHWSGLEKLGEPYNYSQEHVLDWYPFCFTAKDGSSWLAWASNRLTADRSNKRMEGPIQDNREIFIAPFNIGK
ncbi:MAG: CehA/McbA family metallohydrolase [Candidatus Magasanikbacteria bacterium]|nr:CehA/McbA family metallohydrolase [Candidatus Magasanikbacteria bacterium]